MKANLKQTSIYISFILINWFSIFLTAYFCYKLDNVFVYFLGIFIIASRQHALLVIGHDGAHELIHQNKSVNQFITNVLIMSPFFNSIDKYKEIHLQHHFNTNTENDPNWRQKKDIGVQSKVSLKSFIKVYFESVFYRIKFRAKLFVNKYKFQSSFQKFFLLTLDVFIFFAILVIGLKNVLIFWLLPDVVFLTGFLLIRDIFEHNLNVRNENETGCDVRGSFIDRLLFMPHNVGYHETHHQNPTTPFWKLPDKKRENPKTSDPFHSKSFLFPYKNSVVRQIFSS